MLIRTKWLPVTSLFALLIITGLLAGCKGKQTAPAQTEPPITVTTPAPTEIPMNYITTFQFARPERIGLEYFSKMSDQRDSIPAQKKKEITDAAKMDQFVTMTSKLTDKGEIMIKMGDVAILNVILYYPDQTLYFTFYEHRVKTPDTSFYANSPEEQKVLHEFLFSLLNE